MINSGENNLASGTSPFPKYLGLGGWNSLLPAQKCAKPLENDRQVDVLIVGAGFTGIAAARRWAELSPDTDIALIDASQVGEGNAGRNSGFLLEIALAHDANATDLERMQNCNRLLLATMEGIAGDVRTSAVDCGLSRKGTYRGAAGSAGIKALHNYRRFLDAAELPSQSLTQSELKSRIGTRFYREGLYSPHCYLAQPAALVRALAGLLPATVRLYENTPATSIEAHADGWRISTPHGTITAERLVLANNAFCKGLGVGASRVTAMYTYAALTEPLADAVQEIGGSEPEWGLLPAHRLGSTLRRTADDRLLIRSLYGYEREAPTAQIEPQLLAALRRRFPRLSSPRFAAVWSGATGFTWNGAPLWGEVAPRLYISAGCNGGGVVKGTLFGQKLAELAHDVLTDDIPALFGSASWMPPEPLRRIGFRIVSGVERRRARAEM